MQSKLLLPRFRNFKSLRHAVKLSHSVNIQKIQVRNTTSDASSEQPTFQKFLKNLSAKHKSYSHSQRKDPYDLNSDEDSSRSKKLMFFWILALLLIQGNMYYFGVYFSHFSVGTCHDLIAEFYKNHTDDEIVELLNKFFPLMRNPALRPHLDEFAAILVDYALRSKSEKVPAVALKLIIQGMVEKDGYWADKFINECGLLEKAVNVCLKKENATCYAILHAATELDYIHDIILKREQNVQGIISLLNSRSPYNRAMAFLILKNLLAIEEREKVTLSEMLSEKTVLMHSIKHKINTFIPTIFTTQEELAQHAALKELVKRVEAVDTVERRNHIVRGDPAKLVQLGVFVLLQTTLPYRGILSLLNMLCIIPVATDAIYLPYFQAYLHNNPLLPFKKVAMGYMLGFATLFSRSPATAVVGAVLASFIEHFTTVRVEEHTIENPFK